MSESPDSEDLSPETVAWLRESLRDVERMIVWAAPRTTGKAAAITDLLRFRAEWSGEWVEWVAIEDQDD